MLDHIADNYTSPAISLLSNAMKLSQAVAGATLLAFSNGVTDVLTLVVASIGGDFEDDLLSIGSMFGASSFCITAVLFLVVANTPEKRVFSVSPYSNTS